MHAFSLSIYNILKIFCGNVKFIQRIVVACDMTQNKGFCGSNIYHISSAIFLTLEAFYQIRVDMYLYMPSPYKVNTVKNLKFAMTFGSKFRNHFSKNTGLRIVKNHGFESRYRHQIV